MASSAPEAAGTSQAVALRAATPEKHVFVSSWAAREEGQRIREYWAANREVLNEQKRQEEQDRYRRTVASLRDRHVRWEAKLSRSPFGIDLLEDSRRAEGLNKQRQSAKLKQQQVRSKQRADEFETVLRSVRAGSDPLLELRHEKRLLLDEQRRLNAMRSLAKTEMATQRANNKGTSLGLSASATMLPSKRM
mmetsp:Transcript_7988/g.17799  ORF Transcript_7988/g.17799 Transcript_7988/m.17799 type:complete len:192 (-) Transcript_7988:1-576(-)